jgi:hypothetical protein
VPNCDCRGPYHVDFLGASFVANPHVFALKNFRKINGQFFENGTIGNQCTVGSFVIEVAAGDATVGSTPAPAAGLN